MTTYSKTDNYALNLYGDTDPADLRDGYNGSMHILDTTLETHLTRIEDVESRETHDEEVVRTLLGDNTVDAATTSKTKWDNAATGATDSMTALTALGTETAAKATTAKAKWDKASTDAATAITDAATATTKATANTDALTALGTETAAKAATAKNKWDRASTDAAAATIDIARILKTLSETNGHLVTFGDSYGINSDKTREWPTVLNSRLGEDSVLHNYCVAGSGYIAPNSTYQSELVTAKADASYDHNQ